MMKIEQLFQKLHHSIEGYRQRPQQIELAEAVSEIAATSVEDDPSHALLAIEAPTGVGKTLGYLAGGVAAMETEDRKLVISTATVNLQDQIINKDLPLLLKSAGIDHPYALAKGRGRFLCTMRLDELIEGGKQEEIGGLGQNVLSFTHAKYQSTLSQMAEQLEKRSWDGDLDHWPQLLPTTILSQITNTREGCLGRRCNRFEGCPFHQMRNRVMEADIIVANHALVLQDLALGGGVILPPPEEVLHIVDEGHRLHRTARDVFSGISDLAELKQLGTDQITLLNKLSSVSPSVKQLNFGKINRLLYDISRVAETLEMELNGDGKLLQSYQENQREHRLPEQHPWRQLMRSHGGSLENNLARIHKTFENVLLWIQEDFDANKMSRTLLNRFKPIVGAALQEIHQHLTCWQQFLLREKDDEPPVARWLNLHEGDHGLHITLRTAPVSVAKMLRGLFWEKAAGAVLTSATLRSLGNFDLINEQLGLDLHTPYQMRVVESPFQYPQQARLQVPWMEVTPESPVNYLNALPGQLDQTIDPNEATLLLFTARSAMEQCAARLSPPLQKIALVQDGRYSPEEMVKLHHQRVERGEGSLLVGLNRFSEGVDLPGKLCTHVIITKLPFPYFHQPVDRSESEWLRRMGRDPFVVRSLPEASIRLIQMAGRLLRTESDRGRITILDRRVALKRYGKQLLNALPPYRREVVVSRPMVESGNHHRPPAGF